MRNKNKILNFITYSDHLLPPSLAAATISRSNAVTRESKRANSKPIKTEIELYQKPPSTVGATVDKCVRSLERWRSFTKLHHSGTESVTFHFFHASPDLALLRYGAHGQGDSIGNDFGAIRTVQTIQSSPDCLDVRHDGRAICVIMRLNVILPCVCVWRPFFLYSCLGMFPQHWASPRHWSFCAWDEPVALKRLQKCNRIRLDAFAECGKVRHEAPAGGRKLKRLLSIGQAKCVSVCVCLRVQSAS